MRARVENAAHAVAPEEVMAYLDGELDAEEAVAVAAHLRECGECAALAEELGGVSRELRAWTVESAPAGIEHEVRKAVRERTAGRGSRKAGFGGRRMSAWGGAAAALVVLGVALRVSYLDRARVRHEGGAGIAMTESFNSALAPQAAGAKGRNFAQLQELPPAPPMAAASRGGGGGGGAQTAHTPQGPMIARTASLTVLVKNVADARAALDAVMVREQGYAAQLTFSTPEAGARSLQASLRVPAGQLSGALEALRKLGRVEEETQSGEEVTQQHFDLVARLQNAREEESRLRSLLPQRTGKIEDVLQVEEEIARVRGEIEQVEAEQKGLEHRVDFASVELRLVEVYAAQLGSPAAEGTGTRLHNAFVVGVRNAGTSLVGLVAFVEEYGPVILIWVVLLSAPAWVAWRRYRRARASLL